MSKADAKKFESHNRLLNLADDIIKKGNELLKYLEDEQEKPLNQIEVVDHEEVKGDVLVEERV